MQVSDIACGSFETVDAETDVETVRTTLLEGDTDAVFVTGTPRPGLVTRRPTATPEVDTATASSLARPLPALPADANLRDAARALVANRVPVVPVGSGRDLTGRVPARAVLERVPDEAEPMTVAEARTRSAATPPADLSADHAAVDSPANSPDPNSGIAYGGELVGTASADPAAATAARGSGAGTAQEAGDGGGAFRPGAGSVSSRPGLDLTGGVAPVDESVRPGDPVAAAVGTMLRGDHDGVPVSPADGDRVTGVLTRADVLDALAGPDRTTMDLDLVNGHHLRATTREEVATELAATVGDWTTDSPRGTVRLARADTGRDDRPAMRCTVSVRAGDARRSVTADAEDADLAVTFAMERLERTLERD